MKKVFYATPELANAGLLCFAVGLLLIASPAIFNGVWHKVIVFFGVALPLLIIFWVGAIYGLYITIKNKSVRGTVFFIPSRVSEIKDIVSLKKRATFGGLINEIYMLYKKPDGTISDRGLTSIEMLKPNDLNELIETIKTINPSIDIPADITKR